MEGGGEGESAFSFFFPFQQVAQTSQRIQGRAVSERPCIVGVESDWGSASECLVVTFSCRTGRATTPEAVAPKESGARQRGPS